MEEFGVTPPGRLIGCAHCWSLFAASLDKQIFCPIGSIYALPIVLNRSLPLIYTAVSRRYGLLVTCRLYEECKWPNLDAFIPLFISHYSANHDNTCYSKITIGTEFVVSRAPFKIFFIETKNCKYEV